MSLPMLALAQGGNNYSHGSSSNYYSGSNECVVELQTHRGRVIETFYAFRCRRAKRQCQNELNWRHDRGRNPRARCVVVQRPGHGRKVIVDEVHFYHRKTARAIQMCLVAQRNDYRCDGSRRYSCSPCSQVRHSDHSRYLVYKNQRRGGGRRDGARRGGGRRGGGHNYDAVDSLINGQ